MASEPPRPRLLLDTNSHMGGLVQHGFRKNEPRAAGLVQIGRFQEFTGLERISRH